MLDIQKKSVLLSFLGLWLTSYLSISNQTLLGLGLIFSFGILHGANDLQLIRKIEGRKSLSFWQILIIYIVMIVLSVVFFLQIPIVALLLFIIVSAYHFGEQNWQEVLKNFSKKFSSVFQFSYGILILIALLYFNAMEAGKIINKIAGVNIEEVHFLSLFILSCLFYLLLSIAIIKNRSDLKMLIIEQSFYIVILCIIFKVASLFLGFAIYFIFWHSIPSLYDQIKYLYGSYSFENFKKYFKSAVLYWVISLVGVFILYSISKEMVIFDALFFSFLASITFPHFIIMLKMYQK